jgi:hypothetical protein
MSKTAVQFHQYRCDAPNCTTGVIHHTRPEGWTSHTKVIGPCGLTDYYDRVTHDFCPECSRAGKGTDWANRHDT